MTYFKQKYVDVDFTVIQPHPTTKSGEVETVVACRRVPAQCFAPFLADKRQIVSAGRISGRHSLDKIARAISAHADMWAQERLDHAVATGLLPAKLAARFPVLSEPPSFKATMRVNMGNLLH